MGLIQRLFGGPKPPVLATPSQLPPAVDSTTVEVDSQAATQRELVRMLTRDSLRFSGIPDGWAVENVQDLIFWPMKNPNSPYPAWEVPARAYGSPTLYAWWKGGGAPVRSRADSPAGLLQSCGGIQSPASEREISVDCMGHKDGDAKHT